MTQVFWVGGSHVACMVVWKACHREPMYIQLLRSLLLHAKYVAENFLIQGAARLCAFVNGLCGKVLNWPLPKGRHQGENSPESFSLGQTERKKPNVLLWICSASQVHNLFGLPWQRWWLWRVDVKQLYVLPTGLSLSAWAEHAEFCKLCLSKAHK